MSEEKWHTKQSEDTSRVNLYRKGKYVGQIDKRIYARTIALACNSYDQDQETIKALVDTLTNARTTIAVMSMPQLDNSVASNEDLLKIMNDSFEAVLAEKGK